MSDFVSHFETLKDKRNQDVAQQYERNLSLLNIKTLDDQLLNIYTTVLDL